MPSEFSPSEEKILAYYRSWRRFAQAELSEVWREENPQPVVLDQVLVTSVHRVWYECPWRLDPSAHQAYSVNPDILYCPCCDQHGWIEPTGFQNVGEVLKIEVDKFTRVLDRFTELPGRLTVEEAFRLRDEQGCPLELLEERCDYRGLLELIESKKVRVKKAAY
jgi:hypothetical protein